MEKSLKINLELLIHDMLLNNDCIVIPNFGAFVCNYKSAVIESNKSLILPPSKEITFNPLLTKNDGILSTKIAQLLKCSYPQALQYIENHIYFWKISLQHHNYLELNELGSFRVDDNNKWIFTQNNELNFWADSYALSPLKINPIQQNKILETTEIQTVHSYKKQNLKKLAIAASIFFPLLFGSIWISMHKSVNQNWESLDFLQWLNSKQSNEIEVPKKVADMDISLNEVKTFFDEDEIKTLEKIGHLGEDTVWKTEKGQRVWEDNKIETKTTSTIETKQSETKIVKEKNTENTNINQNTPSISEEKFAIIAGCFSSIENAEKYVNELKSKGYPAKVFGTTKTGLHRVAISTFNNETEALENLSQLRLTFAGNTWLLNN
jgi:hypothetical protein